MADPVFKKDKVYQRFNLKELYGVDFSDMPELKAAIGQAIIDKIISRTKDGLAIGGNKALKAYAKEYVESLNFKAYGKSKDNVNMTMSGDMLGTLDIIDESSNTISIGWDDEQQAAKAYNHNTGDTVTKRPFFGLNKSETDELRKQFKNEVRDAVKALRTEGRDAVVEQAKRILDQLSDEGVDG
jgi:hypothetical protein